MQEESNGFFLAVGDGNHSLATAKAIWDEYINIKNQLLIHSHQPHTESFQHFP